MLLLRVAPCLKFRDIGGELRPFRQSPAGESCPLQESVSGGRRRCVGAGVRAQSRGRCRPAAVR